MVQCAGCFKNFTRANFVHHVTTTQNPACIAAHQFRQIQADPIPVNSLEHGTDDNIPMGDIEDDILDILGIHDDDDEGPADPAQPIHNFFGTNYTAEELGQQNLEAQNEGTDVRMHDIDQELQSEASIPSEQEDSDASESEDGDFSPDEMEEAGWEPPVTPEVGDGAGTGVEEQDEGNLPEQAAEDTARARIENALRHQIYVEHFPSDEAGQPVNVPGMPPAGYADYRAQLRGPGSTAVSELLEIPGVQERLELSFKNVRELNKIVDALPSTRPKFIRDEIVVAEEAFEVYMRDVVECLRALFGNAEFARYLVFLPERHYADADQTMRLYYNMHTGKWWWAVQKAVEAKTPGATIMPIIISSDKTQVTLFRNKTAYPVYLTIGNLPKEICGRPSQGGQILIAYLPTSKLDHITNKAARRRMLANLFHTCMERILEPLKALGTNGILMTSGDGITRRIHPIFAAYIGDYPEQLLVTGVKTGLCAVCPVPHDELGDFDATYPRRDIRDARTILALADGPGLPSDYANACRERGMKPIYHLFWMDLPYSNIFLSITPDILHQVLQGFRSTPIAADYPPNHNVRLFLKGITPLSRLTGKEHADICRILLGIVIDLPLSNNVPSAPLMRVVRAMLDFVYLAQYPIHSDDSLRALEDALRRFHENKDVFVDMGVHQDFNIPKLHYCSKHWRQQVEYFGTVDNFNTEFTERLHIDFAKDAYRATNKKNEYPQMTLWLERKEKVLRHERYINWELNGCPPVSTLNPIHRHHVSHIKMPKHPSTKGQVSFEHLRTRYGATQFRECLAQFIVQHKNPEACPAAVREQAALQPILFHKVPVYHKARFWKRDFPLYRHASDEYDVVHARPARYGTHGNETAPGRFDTALINNGTGRAVGVQGC
ncbi:hypothetical protein NM688_g6483 [Phlebia brevispora]|uniref:Uncharacterized protein n=1 Tax=Phlebia brevispora TaxID=194682 RepID=A0ACC1SFI6_9APHY|nr:hypothetical protein NM688_g6483 [Phlebia brevispora]